MVATDENFGQLTYSVPMGAASTQSSKTYVFGGDV